MKYVDTVIVGGGIAGLWTLAAASSRGFNCLLLERDALGCGQTLSSQGIIHGGSKYSLHGTMTQATATISDMPNVWTDALAGIGPVNLSDGKVHTQHQFLIPSASIDSKVLSFFGSKTMSSHTTRVAIHNAPDAYQHLNIKQSIFQLNEPVLAMDSVLHSLHKQFYDSIYQFNLQQEHLQETNEGFELQLSHEKIHCRNLLIACGNGFSHLHFNQENMQQRPLHMLMAKGKNLPAIYAHFIGRSSSPLLTITSHPTDDGQTVWYLGGGIAENGIKLKPHEQQDKGRKLLSKVLPNMNFSDVAIDSFFINRAEPAQQGLLRPDDAYVNQHGNLLIGWPTKLALAPRFAEKAIALMSKDNRSTKVTSLALAKTTVAPYPWHAL